MEDSKEEDVSLDVPNELSDNVQEAEPEAPASPEKVRRALLGSAVGTAFEWFDFSIYGVLAGVVFPAVFFPVSTPAIGLLAGFGSFAVGLVGRPIGAIAFSNLTDKHGRKPAMVICLLIAGVASLAIGCLPSYHQIGVIAPMLLIILRFAQGFSLGGEGSSAQVMGLEYAPENRRGFYGALVNFGNPLGQFLGAAFLLGAGLFAGGADGLSNGWAWRIPFFFGALITVVGFFIRHRMEESPAFVRSRNENRPVKLPLATVFRTQSGIIIRLVLLWVPNVALSFLVTSYCVSYVSKNLGMGDNVSIALLCGIQLVGLITLPLAGLMSDIFGRKRTLYVCMGISAVGVLVLFPLLDTKNYALMFLAMILTQGAQLGSTGVMAALFAEPFPTPVRYSGHAAVYTLENLVGGAPAPFVAALLLQLTGTTTSIVIAMVILYIVGLIMLKTIPETRWLPFQKNTQIKH